LPARIQLQASREPDIGLQAEQLVARRFAQADTDKDGRMPIEELQRAFGLASADMVARLDADRDGVVSKDELPRTLILLQAQLPNLAFWHNHFASPGEVTVKLPPGDYLYRVGRGPEYTVAEGTFTVGEGVKTEVPVTLARLADLAGEGWYSGDLHTHRPQKDMRPIMEAENLQVAPTITWWNKQNPWTDDNMPKEPVLQFGNDRCCDIMAGEDERKGGAFLYFNLDRPLDIASAEEEYPSPLAFLERARKRSPGVWIDIEKPFWWDVPVALAHGFGDSIGLANNHMWMAGALDNEAWGRPRGSQYGQPHGNAMYSQDLYYQILNSGFRLPPSAGSASGVMMNPVGYNRVYVHIEGPFAYEKWWEGLRAGNCFVTNGPLLRVRANGELPGHVFRCNRDGSTDIEVTVELDGSDDIPAVEIIKNGLIDHAVPVSKVRKEGSLGRVTFHRSGWFLVRAISDNKNSFRFASTGPYYVEGEDNTPFISKQAVSFFIKWVGERMKQIVIDDEVKRKDVLAYHERARAFWEARLAQANAE
jgi:hypothetical protein